MNQLLGAMNNIKVPNPIPGMDMFGWMVKSSPSAAFWSQAMFIMLGIYVIVGLVLPFFTNTKKKL